MRWLRRPEPANQIRPVAFFGLFGVGNFGNEASLSAGLDEARRLVPDVPLICVCAIPERVAAEHGVEAVWIGMSGWFDGLNAAPRLLRRAARPFIEAFRWITAFRFARRSSAVIVPGTGILDDFGVRPREMPYEIFRWSLICKLARTPFALVGVGAGPIEHPASRWLIRRTVENSSHCSYRDVGSKTYMASIGTAGDRHEVVPDVVMALPRPLVERGALGGPKTVGVGVMTYFGWDNDRIHGRSIFESYIDRISAVVSGLLDRGHAVEILVGEDGDDTAVAAVLAKVAADRPADHAAGRVRHAPVASMGELLARIGSTDAVIATRFHNVVGALMMARPVVSIGYADKNAELLANTGLGAYCHRIDDFEPAAILADLDDVLDRWEALAPQVEQRIDEFARLVHAQFDLVLSRADAALPR